MKTAIVYSHKAVKTTQAAKMIKKDLGIDHIDDIDIESISPDKLKDYNLLILGVPTWFDGELPYYWDEVVPALEDINFRNIKVAIFGNGDQVKHPENFGDAVGIIAEVFENSGATIIGNTSINGFTFESTRAIRDGKFIGLVLDFENQHKQNAGRIKDWTKEIKAIVNKS